MAKTRRFSNGDIIIRRGNVEKRMYVILNGEVEVSINDGIKKIVIAVLNKHDFFGEISLFSDMPRSADAIAVGSVKAAFFDSTTELDMFLKVNPKYSIKMVNILAERIAHSNKILYEEIMGTNSAKSIKYVW
jgi:CRP-like cAMP-binding protein